MGKLRGEKDIEATIQRLDRLTLDEGRATAAQTLEVVYGLVQHKRAIMEGENSIVPFFLRFLLNVHIPRRRRERISNWYFARSRYGFNRLATTEIMSDWVVECMQEIVSELKKEQRRLFLYRCLRRQPGNTERELQATSCSKTSGTGFHLQTHGRTTTSPVNLAIVEPELGALKATLIQNGSFLVQVRSCGFMESVSISCCILSCD
jgi:hypothetical protein